MRRGRRAWPVSVVLPALLLAAGGIVLAYPLCWTDPETVSSGAGGKTGLQALFDHTREYLHVCWYDAADEAIYHCACWPGSTGYDCGIDGGKRGQPPISINYFACEDPGALCWIPALAVFPMQSGGCPLWAH